MRLTLALACMVCLVTSLAVADDADNVMTDGVLIAHHPPGLQFSSDTDWYAAYYEAAQVTDCMQQNPRIDQDGVRGQLAIWYVLAAFGDSTSWTAAEFGLGTFDPSAFRFEAWGPCYPETGSGLQMTTEGWPGPNEGATIATTRTPWTGAIAPIYYFAGYAYHQALIPLSVNPKTDFAGTCVRGSDTCPPIARRATALGALGVFADGVSVCPPEGSSAQRLEELRARFLHRAPERPRMGEKSQETETKLLTAVVLANPGPAPRLSLTLDAPRRVTVKLHDLAGRVVATPQDGQLQPGTHEVFMQDGTDPGQLPPAGVYEVLIYVDGKVAAQREVTILR